MGFVKLWGGNAMIKKIEYSICNTITNQRPKVLIKERRHTIRAMRFFGCICFRALWTSSAMNSWVKKLFMSVETTGSTSYIKVVASVGPCEQKILEK